LKRIVFEFGKRPGHFAQIKAWKHLNGINVNLSSNGGHSVSFENRKIYPIKFLIKHYSLRSEAQAKKKIFFDRLPRFEKENKEKGWHTQYNIYNENSSFIFDKDNLINWNAKTFESEYLVERISGIGIIR